MTGKVQGSLVRICKVDSLTTAWCMRTTWIFPALLPFADWHRRCCQLACGYGSCDGAVSFAGNLVSFSPLSCLQTRCHRLLLRLNPFPGLLWLTLDAVRRCDNLRSLSQAQSRCCYLLLRFSVLPGVASLDHLHKRICHMLIQVTHKSCWELYRELEKLLQSTPAQQQEFASAGCFCILGEGCGPLINI